MAEPIRKLIRKAATLTIRQMDNMAKQYDLTGLQMSVIDFLGQCPGYHASQHAIEREFGIQRSSTTVMLQRMEKRGLVNRSRLASDRRQFEVQLTPHAKELVAAVQNFIRQDDQSLRSQFTASELKATTKVLQRLIQEGEE